MKNNKTDSTNACDPSVNTSVRSNVPKCTQQSLREQSPPSWIRTNPLQVLMPHIPQDKSDKTHESPTYWGLKELPIDLYHMAAILSPRRTKCFVFARPVS